MIKCLVSDVDGTLFLDLETPTGIIEETTIKRVQELTASGVRLVMASGRDHLTAHYLESKLNVKVDGIGQNGGVIMIDNEVLMSFPIDESIIHSLLELMEKTSLNVNILFIDDKGRHVFAKPYGWMFDLFKVMLERKEITYLYEHDFNTFRLSEQHPFIKAVVICDTTEDRDAFTQEMVEHLANHSYDWFYSSPQYIEIMSKNINKGTGVLHLARVLNLQLDEIAVVGDSYNDISMFKVTPHSFAMDHGDDEVKAYARHEVSKVDEVIDYILEYNQRG
ncbi:MAG: Cof-type HAD-IIB family hydrolase [Erysipelotrichaceae bacterium]|nr:Cof-type HAD-IIB family hydrolase [Erysipelotrichaceae bacterium]